MNPKRITVKQLARIEETYIGISLGEKSNTLYILTVHGSSLRLTVVIGNRTYIIVCLHSKNPHNDLVKSHKTWVRQNTCIYRYINIALFSRPFYLINLYIIYFNRWTIFYRIHLIFSHIETASIQSIEHVLVNFPCRLEKQFNLFKEFF